MDNHIETMEIMGSTVAVRYAAQKDDAFSLRRIEEMLLSAHLQEARPASLQKQRTRTIIGA